MWVELIVPLRLIIGVFHVECFVVDTLVMPLTLFIEQVHLFSVYVRIDHVKVQAGVLLEPGFP